MSNIKFTYQKNKTTQGFSWILGFDDPHLSQNIQWKFAIRAYSAEKIYVNNFGSLLSSTNSTEKYAFELTSLRTDPPKFPSEAINLHLIEVDAQNIPVKITTLKNCYVLEYNVRLLDLDGFTQMFRKVRESQILLTVQVNN